MKKIYESLGFTLIEILIVIAIIGILAAIALVSFTGAQRQARDTNRKSDLRMYETALVQYASKNKGKFPSYSGVTNISNLCGTLDISNCPPDIDDTYRYVSNGPTNDGTPKATQYVIWSTLEATNDVNDAWVICSGGSVGTYYDTPNSFNCPPLNEPEPLPPATQPPAETNPPTGTTGTATPLPTASFIPTSTPTIGPLPTCIPGGRPCGAGSVEACGPGYECIAGRCVSPL